jgi:superoxide dismutase
MWMLIKLHSNNRMLIITDIFFTSLQHAYYLDYKVRNCHMLSLIFHKQLLNNPRATFGQNDRAQYVNVFLNHLVSWKAATDRLTWAEAFVNLGEPKIPVA